MAAESWVRWFDDIRLKDVAAVGGKTASLGNSMHCSAAGCRTALR